MGDKTQNEGYHAPIKYLAKPLEVGEWIKGKCFICNETTDMLPDAYCHYQCANALDKQKKKIVDDFFKKSQDKQ